jgi:hypothetical protein
MKTDKTVAFISDKLHGRPVSTPPGEPVNRDQMMTSAIHDKLQAGPTAPGDTLTPGDTTDAPANDAASIEAEARDKLDQLDPQIIVAIDDPADPSHAVAVRLLAAYVALVKIERQKAGTA